MWGSFVAWVLRLIGRSTEEKAKADRAESDQIHAEAREKDPEGPVGTEAERLAAPLRPSPV